MLEQEDLQAIQKMIDTSAGASEERIMAKTQELIAVSDEKTKAVLSEAEGRIMRSAMAMMEQYFDPKFNLLAENQQMILQKVVPAERVEKLESDVDLLKIIVRRMREDIDQLKGA